MWAICDRCDKLVVPGVGVKTRHGIEHVHCVPGASIILKEKEHGRLPRR